MRKWLIRIVLIFIALPPVVVCTGALFNGGVSVGGDFRDSVLLNSPPLALAEPVVLKVVTFNIQDAWIISGDRPARMRAIGATLSVLDPDIVGLQEAFIAEEISLLLAALEGSKLQYHQYYGSATVGSGLLLLSAFPIAEIYFHRYTVANPFYTVWEGDWWVGKGVSLARLALPEGAGYLDVYNTHAQAHHGSARYDGIRLQQMAELAAFVNDSRLKTVPALLVGDLNCSPGDAEYVRAVEGAGLVRLMNLETRIDHIFGVDDGAYDFDVVDTVEIQETVSIGGRTFELSDHSGYMSTIRIRPTEEPRMDTNSHE